MKNYLGRELWYIYEDLKRYKRIGFLTDDEFQKYFLGFISYKYLSEKLEAFINNKLKEDNLTFEEAYKHDDYKKSLREDSIKEIGYFLTPDLLFKNVVTPKKMGVITLELERAFNEISDSSVGSESEEDFRNLFEGVDLNASQLGRYDEDKNRVVFNILDALKGVHFDLDKDAKDNRILNRFIMENMQFDNFKERTQKEMKRGLHLRRRSAHNLKSKRELENIRNDFAELDSKVDMMKNSLNESSSEKMAVDSDYSDEDYEKEINNLIGSGFEYLLSKFSLISSSSADFYTPNEVSTLISGLIHSKKKSLDSVYDPCCGSASLLLEVHKTIPCEFICGQEINASFYNIARENMILHNIHYEAFDIKQGDTLEQPQHLDYTFESIVCQIPFNSRWTADKAFLDDVRFREYNILAPRTKADYAFIQHMLYHLRDDGIMLVVAPHGVLFRGAAEGKIREIIVGKKNYLDAVIGLPANMFYSTNIPACLLIFRKDRDEDDDILFIDASRSFRRLKLINSLRDKDIKRIVDIYDHRREIEKYSHRASLDEIRENDFNLNIPRYVDTFVDEDEKIDPKKLAYDHKKLIDEITDLNKEIDKVSRKLNVDDILFR